MKMAVCVAIVASVVWSVAAIAGSVEIGFADNSSFDRWMEGGPVPTPSGDMTCEPAGFDEISDCPTVVVSNHSPQAIDVKISSSDEAFQTQQPGGLMSFGADVNSPLLCQQPNVRFHLEPGKSCFQSISYWARTGGVHRGIVRVLVETGAGSALLSSVSFNLVGSSNYPPELQAAEEVRERHERELKKIPHVASVELSNEDGIRINVTVRNDDDIPAVRKLVPPRIEGYETEVTEYVERGVAL